jgi:hypothetical protein
MSSMTPINLIQMIRKGGNPQQLVLSMLGGQAESNPILANLVNLAKQNRTQEMEKIARNLFAEKGLDYDKEFNSFKEAIKNK